PYVALAPSVVRVGERLTPEQRQRAFNECRRVLEFRRLRVSQDLFKLVNVDIGARSVEPVALVLAPDRGPEQSSRVADRLAEPRRRPARVGARPERFEQLVAL